MVSAVHYLDKLAQVRKCPFDFPQAGLTHSKPDTKRKPKKEGQALTTLQKRARAKYMTQPLAMKLVELSSPLNEGYKRTLTCAHYLVRVGNEVKTKYCNARWCLTCNRIRTGKLMNAYCDRLNDLPDLHFVTLTAPNVQADELPDEISRLIKVSRKIQDVMRKRGEPLTGIRKLEATYNSTSDTYHPHFHYLVSGRAQAEMLRDEWLLRNPAAVSDAQDIKPANENSIKELFKYFTKLNAATTPPDALDTIFCAMQGRRVFQPLGVMRQAQVSEEIEEIQAHTYSELGSDCNAEYEWQPNVSDWVDIYTGECLTKYRPSIRAKNYVRAIEKSNFDRNNKHRCPPK